MSKKASWETYLLKNKQGAYLPCLNNVVAILTHRDEWRNVIAYDAFGSVVVKKRQPPRCEDTAPDDDSLGDWAPDDSRRTVIWITREYNCPVQTYVVDEAVQVVARRWVVHPVRDYLNELRWDHKSRIDNFLVRVAGAKDSAYVRAVTKNFFVGAVARVFQPGSKVDTMLILEGEQYEGKSTIFRVLASDDWFLDTLLNIGSKDGYQALRRKWIIEWPELAGLSRVELARVKAFISSPVDSYRPSYGRAAVDFPRQCVFGGTINPSEGYLNDPTGARRFQPVAVGKVDLKMVREERDQLWAEAVVRYRKNEPWHLTDSRLLKAAAETAGERREPDPWETHFREFLSRNRTLYRTRGVTIAELLTHAIDMPKDRQNRAAQIQAGKALRAIGWIAGERAHNDVRRYFPAEKPKKTVKK